MTFASLGFRLRRSIRERGLGRSLLRGAEYVATVQLAPLSPAIARLCSIRFLPIFGDRIGHLAVEPDCFLKERALGDAAARGIRAVVCLPADRLANRHLAGYWRRRLTIIRSPRLCALLRPLSRQKALQFDVNRYVALIDGSAAYPQIQRAWGNRPPLLELTEEDVQRGRVRLTELGVPRDAWFACLHVREAGYSPEDDALHDYRNCDVRSFLPAVREIRARGGWVVRLGDPSMQRLPAADGVIDYAHSPLRRDWMDIFLCAACRLFVGTSSGLCNVASVFGRPCALADLAPLGTVLPYGVADVGIPKLLYSEFEQRYLSFVEAFAAPVSNFRFAHLYRKAGIRVQENSSEEIAALISEVLDRLDGTARYTAEDESRQARFKSLMRQGHYSLGAPSRVGRDFLRSYERYL